MHGRLFPKKNVFSYGMYYLHFPLSMRENLPLAYNRFAPLSFYGRDHGLRDGSDLESWARGILMQYGGENSNDWTITLMCMPRVFGYVFNPVSFWLCRDKEDNLRAVLCEVHNTFGEDHTYICMKEDQSAITHRDVLQGEKLFHVSPFLEREGHYTFKFDCREKTFKVWIDFYDAKGDKKLVTSLIGHLEPMNKATLRKAFWGYPLITFKAIALIHWQALKLVSKGIKYISRPKQKPEKTSRADDAKPNITKI